MTCIRVTNTHYGWWCVDFRKPSRSDVHDPTDLSKHFMAQPLGENVAEKNLTPAAIPSEELAPLSVIRTETVLIRNVSGISAKRIFPLTNA